MAMNPSPTKPNNLVQTIERVSLILDMVGQNPQGMSIRDLSFGLKLPKGTVHRLLSSLSYFGYIRQDPETKNYFLGLKLMELSTHLGNQLDFRKVAEPILRELAERTKQTAHMVIYDRDEVVYIEKIETEQPAGGLKMASRVGSRNPAHSSAVGKVLLSCFSEEAVEAFLAEKGLPRRTANTITDPGAFREHLQDRPQPGLRDGRRGERKGDPVSGGPDLRREGEARGRHQRLRPCLPDDQKVRPGVGAEGGHGGGCRDLKAIGIQTINRGLVRIHPDFPSGRIGRQLVGIFALRTASALARFVREKRQRNLSGLLRVLILLPYKTKRKNQRKDQNCQQRKFDHGIVKVGWRFLGQLRQFRGQYENTPGHGD